jgi:hypothetical protein
MITRPPSRATLVPNSLVCGAIRRVLATATRKPNTIRPTRPGGTVRGSVSMKNTKINTSGEVTITRQKSYPHTGANAHRAVMQWPDAASTPTPAARVIQNVAAAAWSRRRVVIRRPPRRITAYAISIHAFSGAHQKSSGSTRVLPSTTKATTSPMFDGLKTCEPR